MKTLSFAELELPDDPEVHAIIWRWLDRGDGIAVYENHDLGHHQLGDRRWVSYGSSEAQLETEEPPERLPDIGSDINWRYCLVGVYRLPDDPEG